MPDLTDDAFLGGQLQILQPQKGYRAAIDAVCLAAAIPAKEGERVLDIGFGVGVAGLCLAKRQMGVMVTGLEIQPDVADIALKNIKRNSLRDIEVIVGDIFDVPRELKTGSFDHVMTNPPFYDARKALSPPNQSKSLAHMHKDDETIEKWVESSIAFLKPKGLFTIVYPAENLDDLLGLLCGPLGNVAIFPLWPGNGKAAKRVIMSGQKGAAGPVRLLPGLRLHAPPRRYAPEAEEVLRDGAAIMMV